SFQSNHLDATSGAVPYIDEASTRGATVGYQLAQDEFGNPTCSDTGPKVKANSVSTPCNPSGLQSALNLGIAHHAAFIEVFPPTVAAYEQELLSAHQQLDSK